MRYVFFGTPDFASIVLKTLVDADMPPVALVCNPDRPVGRKKVVTPPPTKALLSQIQNPKPQIQILQPEKLDEYFFKQLRDINADFYIVAAYAKILKKELIDIPRMGVIGVHPSLLPKYRGSSPIQTAILNGETKTGVSLFMIDEKVDHGSILAEKSLEINPSDHYKDLERRLAELAGNMLVEFLPKFYNDEIKARSQDHNSATFTQKFDTEDGFVDYNDIVNAEDGNEDLAIQIHNKIRALGFEPGVYTIKDGKRIKLLDSSVEEGKLYIKKLQREGKNPVENKARL